MRVESRLGFPIGRKSGANFLSQPLNVVDANVTALGHSNEKRSSALDLIG